ncbi:MAG: DUF4129 domain-containing protein [Haloarculaceae archaeon]
MDDSRIRPRTVAIAALCLAVIAFGAATLDSTTSAETGFGFGGSGPGDRPGGQRTPQPTASGDSATDGSLVDLNLSGGVPAPCYPGLAETWVQIALLLGLLGLFALVRWYDDAVTGIGVVFLVGYPGFFLYLLLTSCANPSQTGLGINFSMSELSKSGRPIQRGGGLFSGDPSVTSPTLLSQLLLIAVVGLLGVVAILVLTGDHEQIDLGDDDEVTEEEVGEAEGATDVAAVGAAAGRAADRLERDGAFENEVFRAWAEMTEHLSVEHPESSTPAEFASAAVGAGMDAGDVDRLTDLFEAVRYGGAEPTDEREAAAVETLRRIESAYAGDEP